MNRWVIMAGATVILGGIGLGIASMRNSGGGGQAGASAPVKQLLEEAVQYEANGDKIKIKDVYEKIVTDHPDYDKVEEVQEKLGQLNLAIITSNTATPQTIMHEVVPGDSLGKLAGQYNTTKELIKKSNGLKSDVIRVGQKLRIWNAAFNVLVKKGQNILQVKIGDEVVKIYRVSTGANNITPAGTFKIASKLVNPVWFRPGGAPVPAESPENVLGTRWMGFDTDPHYGIHGTTDPDKIGQQVTAGCVRMRNPEVEELFDLLPIGTPVAIQD
ncbi:MAG: L,D-transpeptidase family protein [Candidatus Omnitrophica bacterium]|nr:L,D-transpeptidase family protein [Candidatus Omnitrophota bacterium]